ncbi:MAG: hypothetical protein HKO59_17830 [Phycisphaerales bacterium]|nr:hypothetical protein [Phycisphaerae bacterium]NNF44616.1 hypothetical protein [Phycisphaerales bacterium]NNM27801.1 hypothetical protein [Phycisphaerales bacterium]
MNSRVAVLLATAVLASFALSVRAFVPPSLPRTPPAPTSRPTTVPSSQPETPPVRFIRKADTLARRLAVAHGIEAWRAIDAVAVELTVTLGGETVIDGTMVYDPRDGRVRIENRDGVTMVFDGRRAWVSPPETELPPGPRFHLLTWPYFLAVPFKLHDPGARRADHRLRSRGSQLCETFRLTFESGTGDTPDDWYIVYGETTPGGRLVAMAYTITYGGEPGEREPHAIEYSDFRETAGVTLAHRWVFRAWDEDAGPHGDALGEVNLRNVRFLTPNDHTFSRPDDAEEDPLPN